MNTVFRTAMLTAALWLALTSNAQADGEIAQLRGIVQNLLQDNAEFVKSRDAAYFKPFSHEQNPRATVVTCSDSRVHSHAFDKTPDGDLFMVRNIGNQLRTAEGSVEYGVYHLHTPLLIFVGHTACGAIKAASGNYRKESRPIQRELSTLLIPKGIANMDGVKKNVNDQVSAALKKFHKEVQTQKLTVVGAIYDFRDDLGQGVGRLIVTNVNGNTAPDKIKPFTAVAEIREEGAAPGASPNGKAPPAGRERPHPYAYP
jgi:carbonic anhydrase